MPDSKELLLASAAPGRKIATLLDTERPFDVGAPLGVPWVGQAPPLEQIAVPTPVDGKPLQEGKDEKQRKDLPVTAGWGHAGKGGVTMPGKARIIERIQFLLGGVLDFQRILNHGDGHVLCG